MLFVLLKRKFAAVKKVLGEKMRSADIMKRKDKKKKRKKRSKFNLQWKSFRDKERKKREKKQDLLLVFALNFFSPLFYALSGLFFAVAAAIKK